MFNGTLLIKVSIDDTDAYLFIFNERAEEKKEQMQIVEERK